MRLAVEVRPFGPHPLLGLGVDELRWLAPVRPGDKLHLEGEVVELTPSKAKLQGMLGSNGQLSTNMATLFTPLLLSPSCRAAPLDYDADNGIHRDSTLAAVYRCPLLGKPDIGADNMRPRTLLTPTGHKPD